MAVRANGRGRSRGRRDLAVVMSYVYERAELVLLDALDVGRGPLARYRCRDGCRSVSRRRAGRRELTIRRTRATSAACGKGELRKRGTRKGRSGRRAAAGGPTGRRPEPSHTGAGRHGPVGQDNRQSCRICGEVKRHVQNDRALLARGLRRVVRVLDLRQQDTGIQYRPGIERGFDRAVGGNLGR